MNRKQIGWYCEENGQPKFTVKTPYYIMKRMNDWQDLGVDSGEYFKIRKAIDDNLPYKTTNNGRTITCYYLIDGMKYRTHDYDETIQKFCGVEENWSEP